MTRKEGTYTRNCYDSWDGGFNFEEKIFNDPKTDTLKVIKFGNQDAELVFDRPRYLLSLEAASLGSLPAAELTRYMEPWVYRTCDELDGRGYELMGKVIDNSQQTRTLYGCSGFGTLLKVDETKLQVLEITKMLRTNNWIDAATRAVIVEFFMFEQNSGIVTHVKYLVETASTGGLDVTQTVNSFKQFKFKNLESPVAFIFSICIMLFCAAILLMEFWTDFYGHVVAESSTWYMEASAYHGNFCPLVSCCGCCHKEEQAPWVRVMGCRKVARFVDILLNPIFIFRLLKWLMFIACLLFRSYNMILGRSATTCTGAWPEELELISHLTQIGDIIEGFFVLMLFCYLLVYMQFFSESFKRLGDTLAHAVSNIFATLVIVLVCIFGFALSAWVVYGSLVEEHKVCNRMVIIDNVVSE